MDIALTDEQLAYANFILDNKGVRQKDIDAYFGEAFCKQMEGDVKVKLYIAKSRIERERDRQKSQKNHASIVDAEFEQMADESLRNILADPDNDKHFEAIKFVKSPRVAYSVAYNKALAEKDVAEGNKSRFMPKIVKNDPRNTG